MQYEPKSQTNRLEVISYIEKIINRRINLFNEQLNTIDIEVF